jgi:hypothetical protein
MEAANRMYIVAAKDGSSVAQYAVALAYEKKGNLVEANVWYRKAAEQGHAPAQVNLGADYYNGLGVPVNDEEARYWYKKAAAQGLPLAQQNLDLMARDARRAASGNSEYENTKRMIDQNRRLRCGTYQMTGDWRNASAACY